MIFSATSGLTKCRLLGRWVFRTDWIFFYSVESLKKISEAEDYTYCQETGSIDTLEDEMWRIYISHIRYLGEHTT